MSVLLLSGTIVEVVARVRVRLHVSFFVCCSALFIGWESLGMQWGIYVAVCLRCALRFDILWSTLYGCNCRSLRLAAVMQNSH